MKLTAGNSLKCVNKFAKKNIAIKNKIHFYVLAQFSTLSG